MTEGRIMKAIVILAATATFLSIIVADPANAYTRRADKPPAGDCYDLASQYGADRVWYGLYSGFVSLDYKNRELPYSNRGCFRTEADCRLWVNNNMTFSRGGSYVYSTCSRGVPDHYR